MGADGVETELKVLVSDAFVVPYLGGDGLAHVAGPRRTLDATYWDTPDLRLTRRGHSLRHRSSSDDSEDTWTLKLGDASQGASMSRHEINRSGGPDAPPDVIVEALRSLVGSRTLEPVTRLRTDRSTSYLVDDDGARRVNVEDDRVDVLDDDGKEASSFREIEVELADGDDDGALQRVERRLRDAGAQRPHSVSKVQRALGELARSPVRQTMSPDITVEGLVAHALRDGLERLLANDPAVRLDLGPEGVHQARVATRRLRADLRTMRPLLRRDVVEPLREDLAWVGARLGAVRDLDVLTEEVQQAAVDAGGSLDLSPVLALIERHRADARRELSAAMTTDRYTDIIVRLERATAVPPLGADVDPGIRARKVARRLLKRSWGRLERLATAVDDSSPPEQWHEIRKKAKGTRYAAELLEPLLGTPAKKLGVAAKRIQDELGRSNDAVNAREWLRTHATTPTAAFVAGRLDPVFDAGGGDARRGWPKLWLGAERAASRV
jgi:CHAD domain-containing protein